MTDANTAPRKSVSCSNPWCSNRDLCVHCKGNTATTSPITHDHPKRLRDQPEPGRVVQSDPSDSMSLLGNLLAVIHGDGGHRQEEVGTEQAAREAEEIVTRQRLGLPKPGYVASETYPGGRVQKIVLGYATVAEAMDAHSVLALHFYGQKIPSAGDPA